MRALLKKPFFFTSVIFAVLLIGFILINSVFGWTNPSQNPSSGGGILYYLNSKLGIGTSTPPYLVSISSSTDSLLGLFREGTPSPAYPTVFRQGTDNALVINNNNADILSIKGGNVGIGTTGPAYKLDVDGGSTVPLRLRRTIGHAGGGLAIQIDNAFGQASTVAFLKGGTSNTAFAFSPDGSTAAVLINSSGNVGIGTTSPESKLQIGVPYVTDVVGAIPVLRVLGSVQSISSQTMLRLNRPLSSGLYYSGGVDFNVYAYAVGTNSNTQLDIALKSGGSQTETANVNVMSLRDNGNVGIGDTSPASLLTVGNGDLFQVNSSGDLIKIRNITYTWPSVQGGANTVLTNNGSGTLSWTAGGGTNYWTLSGSSLYPNLTTYNLGVGTASLDSNYKITTSGGGIKAESATQPAGYFSSTSGYGLIVNTGNVGIGTVGPSQKLEVVGAQLIKPDAAWSSGDNAYLYLGAGDHYIKGSFSGRDELKSFSGWDLSTSEGSKVTILQNGNVVVGGTYTDAKLEAVKSSQDAYNAIQATGNGWIGINTNSCAGCYNSLVQAADKTILFSNGTADTGNLTIGPWSNSGAGIRMLSNGNVGIGTASPGAKLEVAGQIKITGGSPANGKVLVSDASGLASWQTSSGGLPTGTSDQTLRYDGTNWVANSVLYNNGTNVGIGSNVLLSSASGGTSYFYGPLGIFVPNGANFAIYSNQTGGGQLTFSQGNESNSITSAAPTGSSYNTADLNLCTGNFYEPCQLKLKKYPGGIDMGLEVVRTDFTTISGSAVCPTNKQINSGGCDCYNQNIRSSYLRSNKEWYCACSAAASGHSAYAICSYEIITIPY